MLDGDGLYPDGFHPSLQARALLDDQFAIHSNRARSTPRPQRIISPTLAFLHTS